MFAAGPGTITAVVHLMNAEKRLWRIVDHQTRQSNLAIGNVVVDALGEQIFSGLNTCTASIARILVNSAMIWSRSAFVSKSVACVI